MSTLRAVLITTQWLAVISLLLLCYIVPIGTFNGPCSSEANSPSSLAPRRPWEVLSNISFFIASFGISYAAYFGKDHIPIWYAVCTPLLVAHIGVASFTYHRASSKETSDWDGAAILLYLSYETGVTTRKSFIIPAVMVFCVPFVVIDQGVFWISAVEIGIIVIVELIRYASRGLSMSLAWILMAMMMGSVAISMYFVSGDGCDGIELLGHGIWHVFVSACIVSLFAARAADSEFT